MSERTQSAEPSDPILGPSDVTSRMNLLAALDKALTAAGATCVLARTHRLVLRYSDGPLEPSGLTNPQLYIFTPGGKDIATTDGVVYRLRSGQDFPVTDPPAAAAAVWRNRLAVSPVS